MERYSAGPAAPGSQDPPAISDSILPEQQFLLSKGRDHVLAAVAAMYKVHMDCKQAVDKEHSHCSLEALRMQAETGDSPDTEDMPDSQAPAVHIPEVVTAAQEMEPERAHTLVFVPAPAAVAQDSFPELMVDMPVVVPGSLERLDKEHSLVGRAEPPRDEQAMRLSHARDARIADRQD